MNSKQKSAYFIVFYHFMASIDITCSPNLRSFFVRFLAFIFSTSHQAKQISTSYASPNSLALIFSNCIFYILSIILAYIKDFSLRQDCIYVYEDVIK